MCVALVWSPLVAEAGSHRAVTVVALAWSPLVAEAGSWHAVLDGNPVKYFVCWVPLGVISLWLA